MVSSGLNRERSYLLRLDRDFYRDVTFCENSLFPAENQTVRERQATLYGKTDEPILHTGNGRLI